MAQTEKLTKDVQYYPIWSQDEGTCHSAGVIPSFPIRYVAQYKVMSVGAILKPGDAAALHWNHVRAPSPLHTVVASDAG